MLSIFLRTIILYVSVIAAMRFTGKRQIGQLQPAEFVIALLISEVASMPMEDSEIPLLASLIPISVLISLEIIFSVINLKSFRFRKLLTGSPIIVIDDGKLDQKALKRLRFSLEDLLDTLRLNGIFDISEVQYAIVETNGELSVLEKAQNRPATASQVTSDRKSEPIPFSVINDGRFIRHNCNNAHTSEEKILKHLGKKGLRPKDIMLMTADSQGNFNIIKKE